MNAAYETFIASLPITTLPLSAVTHLDDLPSNDAMTLKPDIEEWCGHCLSHHASIVQYSIMITETAEYTVTVLETGSIEDATLFRLRWF